VNPRIVATRLLEFAGLLLEANLKTNLVGAKTLDALIAPHLLDSLAPLVGIALAQPVVDLGSGAGLPGIPAAIAWPELRFILIEPRSKRAAFLQRTVERLALHNVTVEQKTAQSAARLGLAGRAGAVLARALAKPERAIGLALPLLRPGGKLMLYLGRPPEPSRSERKAIRSSSGRLVEARRIVVPNLSSQRHVWIIEREGDDGAV
jgi:16S rRNA (guanine527-N7)-methyltransferase